MRYFPAELIGLGFGSELLYSFVIIVCSLMIYIGTKELYELSSYKGIKFFRQAFLFFAIAYFFRTISKFFILFSYQKISPFHPIFLLSITSLIFIYFSFLAIFYLLQSFMWKKWNKWPHLIYLFHVLALLIAVATILSRSHFFYLGANVLLLISIIIIVGIRYMGSDNKKSYNLYAIYLLLFIFWILNIVDILIPRFLETAQLFIYLLSSGIFLLILYKVLTRVGK